MNTKFSKIMVLYDAPLLNKCKIEVTLTTLFAISKSSDINKKIFWGHVRTRDLYFSLTAVNKLLDI